MRTVVVAAVLLLTSGCASRPTPIEPVFVQTEIGPALKGVHGGQVTVAQITNRKTPRYPEDLRQERIQGVVVLEVLIDSSGNLVRITPKSTPHEGFIEPAVEAVKQWHFSPPMIDGRPVALLGEVSVRFELR